MTAVTPTQDALRKAMALAIVSDGERVFRADFLPWLDVNWEIYGEFERLAKFAAKKGTRASARFLIELIRWNSILREGGAYKINGNFAPDCALLFERLNNTTLFEFRRRVA